MIKITIEIALKDGRMVKLVFEKNNPISNRNAYPGMSDYEFYNCVMERADQMIEKYDGTVVDSKIKEDKER